MFAIGQFFPWIEVDKQVDEIDSAHDLADRRHENVIHDRGHDLSKCAADNNADREVNDVAAHGEFFEFFEDGHKQLRFSEGWSYFSRASVSLTLSKLGRSFGVGVCSL